MSQDDLVIANQAFPATRADMNSNYQALGSLMSGSSAPGTTYAYMWWADTTNGVLKQRDSSNASWIIRATLGGSPVLAKSATYSIVLADMGKTIVCDATGGAIAINLLAAATAGNGFCLTIKKKDATANAVTITGSGTENIDLANTLAIANQNEEYSIVSDGTQYWVIGGGATLFRSQTFTGAQRGIITTLAYASTITPDFSLSNNYATQLTGNVTFAIPTNLVAGQDGSIRIRQDATGSRTGAFAWGYTFAGGAAPTLSTAGGTADDLYYSVKIYHSATVTITIASPGVVTDTAHGLLTGQQVQLTTSGALPTGLTASTTYYVIYIDANSYKLATSLANAAAGTAINTSGSQSGTHTLKAISIACNLTKAVG